MVLVEGERADGVIVDQDTIEGAGRDLVERVLAAICGTRVGAAEDGHRLSGTGVVWTDYTDALELRAALRARDIDDVTLVSELHAASALARAVGQTVGWERTALILLEPDSATLAVIRTTDGAVVRVQNCGLPAGDTTALQGMVAGLDQLPDPPEAVLLIGPGAEARRPTVADRTALPVHAPGDAEAALARGAALAAANAPRFDATTIGLGALGLAAVLEAGEDTRAAPDLTRPAPVGHPAAQAYSAVAADVGADEAGPGEERQTAGPEPFLLAGSAAMAVFVVGIVALVAALAISFGPGADRPGPEGVLPRGSAQTTVPSPPLETIPAPVPVVREAPRTVFVNPVAPAPALQRPAVSPTVPTAVPPAAAIPTAPAPAVAVPAPVPAPVVVPIPVPVPVLAPLPAVSPAPVRTPVLTPVPTPVLTPVPSATATPSSAPVSAEVPPPVSSEASETATASAVPSAPTPTPTTPDAPPTQNDDDPLILPSLTLPAPIPPSESLSPES